MIIEEIVKVKRGVYALKLSEHTVEINETLLVKYHLYKGQDMDIGLLDTLKREYQVSLCTHKSIDLLSRRNHFVKELEQKLLDRAFERWVITETLDQLLQEGYINERETAQLLVHSKKETDSYFKIKQALLQRGCPESLCEEVLSQGVGDELEKAKAACEKKTRQLKGQTDDQTHDKLMRFLMGRGFSYGTSKQATFETLERRKQGLLEDTF